MEHITNRYCHDRLYVMVHTSTDALYQTAKLCGAWWRHAILYLCNDIYCTRVVLSWYSISLSWSRRLARFFLWLNESWIVALNVISVSIALMRHKLVPDPLFYPRNTRCHYHTIRVTKRYDHHSMRIVSFMCFGLLDELNLEYLGLNLTSSSWLGFNWFLSMIRLYVFILMPGGTWNSLSPGFGSALKSYVKCYMKHVKHTKVGNK